MNNLTYQLIRSDRKTLAVQISPEGTLIVRAPRRMSKAQIDAFLLEKRDWIEKHLPKTRPQPKLTEGEVRDLARQALEDIPARVRRFAPLVGVTYGGITIRNQRTRWGSCSSQGNLNFNCLLMLTPPEVRDYVVVHELCHRIEMNQSPAFWAQVARILPDYEIRRRWLKENGGALIARL